MKCVCNLCCGKHSCPLHPSEAADAEKCICEICTCLFHHCPVHSGPIAKGDTTHRIHYPEHPVQPRVPFARDDPLGDGVPFLGRTTYESHFPGHAVRAKEKTDIPLPTVAPNAVPLSTEHRDGYLRPESRAPNQGRVHKTLIPGPAVDPLQQMTTAHRDQFTHKRVPAPPAAAPSTLSLALPPPAELTTTTREHFPEHALANRGGLMPAPRKPREVPFVGSTEHRDEYTPKKSLPVAALPAPVYADPTLCPAIPLMDIIPGPASPSWRAGHVLFDTLQGDWTTKHGAAVA